MSGRRQKSLRKNQNKEDKIQKKIELRKLAELPAIPVPKIAEFLASKFIGKSGYHFVSVGKCKSLFLDMRYENIVPIILHNSFPIMSATGRFNDENGKDCAIGLVKVKHDFPGLIVDRKLNMYLNGCSIIVKDEDAWPELCDLERVSVKECNEAIKSQEVIFKQKMAEALDTVKKSQDKMEELLSNPYINDPYIDPYTDPYIDESILTEDMTDYLVDTTPTTETK